MQETICEEKSDNFGEWQLLIYDCLDIIITLVLVQTVSMSFRPNRIKASVQTVQFFPICTMRVWSGRGIPIAHEEHYTGISNPEWNRFRTKPQQVMCGNEQEDRVLPSAIIVTEEPGIRTPEVFWMLDT